MGVNLRESKSHQQSTLEHRGAERDSIYLGDFPKIGVFFQTFETTIYAHPTDISAQGIGLCHPEFTNEMLGQFVEIRLAPESSYRATGVIRSFDQVPFSGRLENRIGIVFKAPKNNKVSRLKRFACPKYFQALAYGQHPFKYDHKTLYTVVDFSSCGMTLKTDSAGHLLFPGCETTLKVLIPTKGNFDVPIEVTNVRHGNGGAQLLGVIFKEPHREFLNAITAYLVMDSRGKYSVRELKENGFYVSDLRSVVHASYVTCEMEWQNLLKLRLAGAHGEGRWIGETDATKMIDEYDRYARQLICKIGDRIVGSGRIVFNDGDFDRTEHGKKAKIPDYLWKDGFTEVSRVTTDPNFRGVDIFITVVQNMARMVFQSGTRYTLMNCETSLVRIYERIGGKQLGTTFYTEYMQDKALNLMLFDTSQFIFGKGVSFIYWYYCWHDIYRHLFKNGFIRPTLAQRIRVNLYTILGIMGMNFFAKKKLDRLWNSRMKVISEKRHGGSGKESSKSIPNLEDRAVS
jgi:hypothetical protein